MKVVLAVLSCVLFLGIAHAGFLQDPIGTLKKETEKVIKNPVRVITAPVKETVRVIEKNTGGDISKAAGNIKKETDKVEQKGAIISDGVSEAIDTLDERPIDGLTRLSACAATACASEIVAHDRAEKIRKDKKAEHDTKVKQAEKQNTQALKDVLNNRVNELKEDLAYIDRQIKSLEQAILLSDLIEESSTDSTELPAKYKALATPDNMKTVKSYIETLNAQLKAGEIKEDSYNQFLALESQILNAAKIAAVDYAVFLNSVVKGISQKNDLAVGLEATNQELKPLLDQLSIDLDKESINTNNQIASLNVKIAAL